VRQITDTPNAGTGATTSRRQGRHVHSKLAIRPLILCHEVRVH
jgi:hypothetical protein